MWDQNQFQLVPYFQLNTSLQNAVSIIAIEYSNVAKDFYSGQLW